MAETGVRLSEVIRRIRVRPDGHGRLDPRVEMLIRYTRANAGERAAIEARRLTLGDLWSGELRALVT